LGHIASLVAHGLDECPRRLNIEPFFGHIASLVTDGLDECPRRLNIEAWRKLQGERSGLQRKGRKNDSAGIANERLDQTKLERVFRFPNDLHNGSQRRQEGFPSSAPNDVNKWRNIQVMIQRLESELPSQVCI
jgi:hypothetical protein